MKKSKSDSSVRSKKLVARSGISNYRIRRLIERYSEGDTVRLAAETTGISHVTAGRIFNLIRQRLLDVGLYQSVDEFIEAEAALEEETDGHFWSHAGGIETIIDRLVSAYRGVRAENRHLYEAEALFRHRSPDVSARELNLLILNVIKRTGPLGSSPIVTARTALFVSDEYRRRVFNRFRAEMRDVVRSACEGDGRAYFRELGSALAILERAEADVDAAAETLTNGSSVRSS